MTKPAAPKSAIRWPAAEIWLVGLFTALLVARALVPVDVPVENSFGAYLGIAWIGLLAGWLYWSLKRNAASLRAQAADGWFALLLLVYVVDAVWAARRGNPRLAINAAWCWIELGVAYFLARQLLTTAARARAVLAVMISLAVALALLGLYEHFVAIPAEARLYEAIKDDPNEMMRVLGRTYAADSGSRHLFEVRLDEAAPTATFALANSLAGFLAAWLVVGLALRYVSRPTRFAILFALGGVVSLACLYLTKSRSAWLALLAALFIATAFAWKRRLVVVGVVAVLLLAGIFATGIFDARRILSDAGQSLGYRGQYWRGSASLLADRPWTGCGPGQFQNAYLVYKLPEASEEIADPHNWLVEIGATAGIPALLALLAGLACAANRLRRPPAEEYDRPERGVTAAIVAIALIGIPLGWAASSLGGTGITLAEGFVISMVMAVGARHVLVHTDSPRFSSLAAPLGALVFAIHWLAAGGVSDPGAAESFWVLLAISLGQRDRPDESIGWKRGLVASALATTLLLGVVHYMTSYRPILRSTALVSEAFSVRGRSTPGRIASLLAEAAAADPYSSTVAGHVAADRFNYWRAYPTTEALEAYRRADERVLALNPASSGDWFQCGRRRRLIFERTHDRLDLTWALAAFSRAVALYPNDALRRAEWALALDAAGERMAAVVQAREAIRLDEITRRAGHENRYLSADVRGELANLAAP